MQVSGEDYIGRVIAPTRDPVETARPPQRARVRGTARRKFLVLNRFWRCRDLSRLSPTAKLAWLYLWSRADARMTCYPSMNRIAFRVGCSRRHARRAIRDLEKGGFLKTRIGGPRPDVKIANFYRVTVPKATSCDTDMGVLRMGTWVSPHIHHVYMACTARAEAAGRAR